MRLPNTAHTYRPWRIHEIARDFRLEDAGAADAGRPGRLPSAGAADRRGRSVEKLVRHRPRSLGAPVEGRGAARVGPPGRRPGLQGADAPRPVAGGPARRRVRPGLRPVYLALPARRRVRRGDGQPDRPRGHALGWVPDGAAGYRGQMAVLLKPNGPVRRRLHGRDQAVPVRDRLPGANATDRAGVAGAGDRAGDLARTGVPGERQP